MLTGARLNVCPKSCIYTDNPTNCLPIKHHRLFGIATSITVVAALYIANLVILPMGSSLQVTLLGVN